MRRGLWIVPGFALVTAFLWAGRGLADPAERAVVLWFNPDRPVPILDQAVLLVTEFSIPGLAVLFGSWALGFLVSSLGLVSKATLRTTLRLVGIVVAVGVAVLLHDYSERTVPLAMAALTLAGFELVGASYARLARETQARLCAAFVAALLATVLTELGELVLDSVCAARPRPFAAENGPWNAGLRVLEDERVRSGSSYVSGHASGLFALVIPLTWWLRGRTLRLGLLVWAALHALTRLYVAAHFPLCVLMGSLLGIAMGSLAAAAVGSARPGPPSALRDAIVGHSGMRSTPLT